MLISTGLSIVNMPDNYYLRVAPRSSLSVQGIDIAAGVVDSDYRGIIKVLIVNNSPDVFPINNAIRIAQLIPEYCGKLNITYDNEDIEINDNNTLRDIRGELGFGSTNKDILI